MARGGSHSQWLGMQSCAKITGSTGQKSTRWGPQPRPTQMLHQDPYSASLPRSWDCASASLDELHWELSASHRMQLYLPIYIWELPKTSSSISLKPGLLRRAHISSVRLGIYRRQRLCLPAQLTPPSFSLCPESGGGSHSSTAPFCACTPIHSRGSLSFLASAWFLPYCPCCALLQRGTALPTSCPHGHSASCLAPSHVPLLPCSWPFTDMSLCSPPPVPVHTTVGPLMTMPGY